jgi:2-dehydro-3-deoxyphosphooctonate aldolase (KDO 8-P synthase)
MNTIARIKGIKHVGSGNFFLMAGPCVVESRDNVMRIAETVANITEKLKIPYIFKASYRKANRSRIDSFSGIGDDKALKILGEVRERFGLPIVTDIHSAPEADIAAEYVDVLQIPAFLCRQTDLLIAAARTEVCEYKKGTICIRRFHEIPPLKGVDSGNSNVILTDRGTMFATKIGLLISGYTYDEQFGFPVVVDVTHHV